MAMRNEVVDIDFTGVESSGFSIDDGNYVAKVTGCTKEVSQSGNSYLKWIFEIADEGPFKGRKLYHNTTLQPQGLFNLQKTLEAIGIPARGKLKLELNRYLEAYLGVVVVNETFQGKKKPKVADVFSVANTDDGAEVQGEEEEVAEEAPAPAPAPKPKTPVKAPAKKVEDL